MLKTLECKQRHETWGTEQSETQGWNQTWIHLNKQNLKSDFDVQLLLKNPKLQLLSFSQESKTFNIALVDVA